MTIALSILFFMKAPIKENFHAGLVKLHITKRCYDKAKDYDFVFAQEKIDYELNDRKITADSLKKLLTTSPGGLRIPTITHHVYFTYDEKPIALSEFYIEKIKNNFNKLNALNIDWQHIIWTNSLKIIPGEILKIKGVTIKQIDVFKDHQLYDNLANIIERGNFSKPYFAEGSDLIRLMAIQKFGGVYSDMDYEIYNPQSLYDLMREFDFLGGREISNLKSYYGNAFMAAIPNHPVINEALKLEHRNYNATMDSIDVPDYVKYPCRETTRVYFNGPPLFTLAYFLKNNVDGNNDIILPTWMIFNAKLAHFKNNQCSYAQMPGKEFIDKNNRLESLIIEFKSDFKQEGGESDDPSLQNVYYNNKLHNDLPIIGADMFCGSWIKGKKFNRRYYWNW